MKMNKKAGLMHFLIILLIFGGIITAFSTGFVQMGTDYNNPANQTLVDSFSKLNATVEEIGLIATNTTGTIESGQGVITESDALRIDKAAFAVIKLPQNSWRFVSTLLSDIANVLKLPAWFVGLVGSIIIIYLAYLIIAALLRLNRTP